MFSITDEGLISSWYRLNKDAYGKDCGYLDAKHGNLELLECNGTRYQSIVIGYICEQNRSEFSLIIVH